MDQKRKEESELRAAVAKSPELTRKYAAAWDRVSASVDAQNRLYLEHYLLERGIGFNSSLFIIARDLVRYAGQPPFHTGFKLFLDEDTNLFSPAEVLGLSPRPDLVTYQ